MTQVLAAHLRVDSLGVTVVLFAAGLVAVSSRFRSERDVGRLAPVRVSLDIAGRDGGRVVDVLTPATIGRRSDSDVIIDDPDVSRRHARLEAENGVVFIGDLSSSNGTFLNGERVRQSIEVRTGDRIDVGTTRLVVKELQPWT